MTVYNTAYDTTACNNYRMNAIVEAVREAHVRDFLSSADGVLYVESSNNASAAVKAFKHPLYINEHHASEVQHANDYKHRHLLAMDVRAVGRIDIATGRFKVKNMTMYRGLVYRAALTSVWLTNGPNAFRSISPLATSIFASWVAETVGFRYNLDPKAKIELMILAAIFYQSNHTEGVSFDKGNEPRYLSAISIALRVNVTDVARIYDQTQAIGSIEDFCTKVKLVLNNVRLEELNAGVVISLMGKTWAGDAAPELCAIALEHPPTWISLLWEAKTNQAVRNSGLSKICERRQFKEGLDKLDTMLKLMAPETTSMLAQEGGGL